MRRVGNALTRRKGVGVFGSALLRHEGVRGFGFGIGRSGVIQMTRDGRRQVGIGRIGVGSVMVVTQRLNRARPGSTAAAAQFHVPLLTRPCHLPLSRHPHQSCTVALLGSKDCKPGFPSSQFIDSDQLFQGKFTSPGSHNVSWTTVHTVLSPYRSLLSRHIV